jgi:hypothetical protein
MIPIECPKCGRGGSVPPDRLNARLVCKACHQVFHLDNTGRMVMGEPQSFDMKSSKSRADDVSGLADFDFAQTWNDIPKPVKFGVPGVLLALFGWLYLGPGPGSPDYIGQAESLVRAVVSNDKNKVVAYATPDSAEAAGQWFDLIHGEFEKGSIDSSVPINPQLFSGNADKDGSITLMVVLSKTDSTNPPVTITIPMKRDGTAWKFDGTQGLEGAAKSSSTSKTAPGKR